MTRFEWVRLQKFFPVISIMEKRVAVAIKRNIQSHGHHVCDVMGGPLPPWSYSIGLSERIGFEVILAGGLYFEKRERLQIIDGCIASLIEKVADRYKNPLEEFCLRAVSDSWPEELFLGAIGYYQNQPKFMQIYLSEDALTLDVPSLYEPWSPKIFPAWKWLAEDWRYPIPPKSVVLTDTDMLLVDMQQRKWHADLGKATGKYFLGNRRRLPMNTEDFLLWEHCLRFMAI